MKFQIKSIIVYGKNGKYRTIDLKTDSVNIITGMSSTGKSALIHIIDYCLGRDDFTVPFGVIRDHVEWYALKLAISSGEIFIARKKPDTNKKSSQSIYFEIGKDIKIPQLTDLHQNTTTDGLIDLLNGQLGIKKYSFEPAQGEPRNTGVANIRKSLFYCFQSQNEIGNQERLFHRQNDYFIERDIKDYLPYFLGAVPDDFIEKKQELRRVKHELRLLTLKKNDFEKIRESSFELAFSLLAEAKNIGLLPEDTPLYYKLDYIKELINSILKNDFEEITYENHTAALNNLLDRQHELRSIYRSLKEELDELQEMKYSGTALSQEISEQHSRLESIKIFDHCNRENMCPLCSSVLKEEIPSVEAIRRSLQNIYSELECLNKDNTYLNIIISEKKEQLAQVSNALKKINNEIKTLNDTYEILSRQKSLYLQQAIIKGRLSLYYEKMPSEHYDEHSLEKQIDDLNNIISPLEIYLNDETIGEKLLSIISSISYKITALAEKLRLEYSSFPMRLDMKKLTVVADSPIDGAIPMSKMGSGETFVSLHLITHLVLHEFFSMKNRPVPQFIFFDQPSQAYFPPDTTAEVIRKKSDIQNADREALIRMFKLIIDNTKNFQVIITEHADINEPWYQSLIREKWWDEKNKLIPVEWISEIF